ncbi:hypothetical protein C0992_010978 [Termitomyces sp. T32_za158]|nr:hypothetical protein C0992_010978 [Termitomyces sp. T32_za158]
MANLTPAPAVHVTPHSIPSMPLTPTPTVSKRVVEDDFELLDSTDITTWLKSLDTDLICGKLSLDYAQYAPSLITAGFLNLSDMVDLSVEELIKYGKMNVGTAKRVIKFAAADHQKLIRDAKRAQSG